MHATASSAVAGVTRAAVPRAVALVAVLQTDRHQVPVKGVSVAIKKRATAALHRVVIEVSSAVKGRAMPPPSHAALRRAKALRPAVATLPLAAVTSRPVEISRPAVEISLPAGRPA